MGLGGLYKWLLRHLLGLSQTVLEAENQAEVSVDGDC